MEKIVIISPCFFDIEKSIIEGFQRNSFEVFWFDERINNSKLSKIILRKFPKLYKGRLDKYYNQVINLIKIREVTKILIIKGESVPIWFLEEVRKLSPKVVMIHYICDPIANYSQILEKVHLFDSCLTFDSEDAKNQNWIHRPLFFPEFENSEYSQSDREYSYSFVGTLHSDRSQLIDEIVEKIPKKLRDSSFIYYFVPMRAMFLFDKYIKKLHSNLKSKDVNFVPLSYSETMLVMKHSNFVIDIHHDSQAGLTNRTMEAVGMNKKLITTNPFIKDYDFYDDKNILIVDKKNVLVDSRWFENFEFNHVDYNREYYELDGFVNSFIEIFNSEIA